MAYTYGFIGCGNMGGALAAAASKSVGGEAVTVTDFLAEKAKAFAEAHGTGIGTNESIAAECDYIFLGVKPQMMPGMLAGIAPVLAARKTPFTLVSMAAGMAAEKIQSLAGGNYPVIRIMPNIPASVGAGTVLYCTKGEVPEERVEGFLAGMKEAGLLIPLEERLIDAGSAVSGCGPAYAFLFIEALADGGVQCGLPRDKATLLAAQTLFGSASLLLKTGKHPGALKDAVCSPGGTTIAGVHALEKGAFRGDVAEAVLAAYEKTLALGR